MKNNLKSINIVLAAILGMLLLSVILPPARAQAADTTPTAQPETLICNTGRSINVTGSAQVNVTPDRALVQLGVQSNGTTVDAVQRANTQAIQQVITAVQRQGVEPKDISTDLYMIEPVYENYDSLFIKGYRIHNAVAITVRDVKKTSAIVSAALAAGANQVNDVNFYTSELRQHRDRARELAVKAAAEKATALAATAGTATGCVLSISENSWSYYNGWWYGASHNAGLMAQNLIQNAAPSAGSAGGNTGDEPISLGQIAIKAEVSVSYALK